MHIHFRLKELLWHGFIARFTHKLALAGGDGERDGESPRAVPCFCYASSTKGENELGLQPKRLRSSAHDMPLSPPPFARSLGNRI